LGELAYETHQFNARVTTVRLVYDATHGHPTAEQLQREYIDPGSPPYAPSDRARDKEIETRFIADENKTDLSQWIDNGTLTEPGDLGYWVGYRIVRSYYRHAVNKHRAVRDIIEMKDPEALLARSGWYPGIRLE